MGIESRAERRKPRVIEIEAPVELHPEQNFYAQPPFDKLILRVSKAHAGIDESVYRRTLTKIVRVAHEHCSLRTKEEVLDRYKRSGSAEFVLGPKQEKSLGEEQAVDALTGVKDLLRMLDLFPDWTVYVNAKMDPRYKNDGRVEDPGTNVPLSNVPSYAAWLERQSKRAKRVDELTTRAAVTEAFPQDLQGESVADGITRRGERPTLRKWRILAASEMTKRR